MAVTSTDLLMIERGGTLYKAPVSELPSGGGGAAGLTLLQKETITTDVAAVDFDLPSGYSRFRLFLQDVDLSGNFSIFRFSLDGGSTFIQTTSYNEHFIEERIEATITSRSSNVGNSGVTFTQYAAASLSGVYDVMVTSGLAKISGNYTGKNSSVHYYASGGGSLDTASIANALRVTFFSGTKRIESGVISLYGYKESV